MSVSEVAVELGISRSTAYEMVHSGLLPSVRLGSRRVACPTRAIRRFLHLDDPDREATPAGGPTSLAGTTPQVLAEPKEQSCPTSIAHLDERRTRRS